MKDSFSIVIAQLERQKTAIEAALAALRDINAEPATAPQIEPAATQQAPTRKRSAAVRRKMALAQKARWDRIKGEIGPPAATPKPPKAKRKISAEGLQRIIAATKKRWRLQRAAAKAAVTKKAAPVGKTAVKKSLPASAAPPALAQAAG